jgi:uncharacterized protein YaaN involved in tellurite resistance
MTLQDRYRDHPHDTITPPSGPPTPVLEPQDLEAQLAELDLNDRQSVLFFGSRAQQSLTEVSDAILERVRTKELGPAGEALNDMVATLRGFDHKAVEAAHRPGWMARLLGRGRGMAKFLQQYEQVREQIEAISARLQQRQTDLLIDIETLDRLYAASLDYFERLQRYIAAAQLKLADLDERVIPERAHAVADDDAVAAQGLRDLRAMRDDLERRLHDLKLTRQVTLQSLPAIRLVQENDKALVGKIESTLMNTVPLWRQQLAQAVTIQRSRDAAAAVRAATDLTNDLLLSNAENLRLANRETREQVERGVFDIETVSEANRLLIEAIEDSLRIASEGREARGKASVELDALEQQLRRSLLAARAAGQQEQPVGRGVMP